MRASMTFGVCLVVAGCASCGGSQTGTESPPPERAPDPEPAPLLTVTGFSTPESVLYDAEADLYLVSNIEGSPLEADGHGFISRVGPDGTVQALRFICSCTEGVSLDAPKGMGLSGDELFVADITNVRVFDRNTGEPRRSIAVEEATFLNDVAVGPNGMVYVSDTGLAGGEGGMHGSGTDAVYKIEPGGDHAVQVASGRMLGQPNGLAATNDGVWVVTFGSGELYRLDAEGARQDVTPVAASLDGVVALDDGSLLVSSWERKAVLHGRPGGPFTPVVQHVESPADIGFDPGRRRILVPLFNRDQVMAFALP